MTRAHLLRMISRRSLIRAAASSAAMFGMAAVSRAATPGICAVTLDGKSCLHLDAPGPLGFPASAGVVTWSACVAISHAPRYPRNPAILFAVDNFGELPLEVTLYDDGTGKGVQLFAASLAAPATAGKGVFYQSADGAVLADGEFHQILLGMNVAAGTATAVIDGKPWSNVSRQKQAPFTPKWAEARLVTAGAYIYNGVVSAGLVGGLAEVRLDVGDAIDLSDPDVTDVFWDSRNGRPRRLAPNGGVALPGNGAQVFLSGGEGNFPVNGARAQYTMNSMTPLAPFAVAGNVVTADSDPWNNSPGTAARRRR